MFIVPTVATMSAENYVNHVPVMTGGRGHREMLDFYGRHFIPKMPADTEIVCPTRKRFQRENIRSSSGRVGESDLPDFTDMGSSDPLTVGNVHGELWGRTPGRWVRETREHIHRNHPAWERAALSFEIPAPSPFFGQNESRRI